MRLFLPFILFILCFSVSLLNAQTPPPQQTIEYWQAKSAQDPQNGLYYFNMGVLFQKQNNYENALTNYNKVIELKSKLSPVAKYYKARIFEATGDIVQAKESLTEINMIEVPPNTRTTILAFKNKLFASDFKSSAEAQNVQLDDSAEESEKKEKRLSLYFDYSVGKNSNPQSLAPTSTTAIVSENQSQFRAGVDYLLTYSSAHDIKINYYYSKSTYSTTSSLNYFYHDITLPIAIFFSSFRLKFTPEYFTDNYDGSLYSSQTGGIADLAYKVNDSYFSVLFQNNDIKNKTTDYSYLSGVQQKSQIGFEQRWTQSRLSFKAYTSKYGYQDTSTLGSSYKSNGISMSFSYYIGAMDLAFSCVSESKQYAKAASDTTARADQKTYFSAQLGYNFATYFRIYADASVTNNKSNYDTSAKDKTYKQNLILAGLSINY